MTYASASPSLSRKTNASKPSGRAGQRALRDRVAAAHQLRGKPGQRSHRGADTRSACLDRPPVQDIHRRDGSAQQAIVDDDRGLRRS